MGIKYFLSCADGKNHRILLSNRFHLEFDAFRTQRFTKAVSVRIVAALLTEVLWHKKAMNPHTAHCVVGRGAGQIRSAHPLDENG